MFRKLLIFRYDFFTFNFTFKNRYYIEINFSFLLFNMFQFPALSLFLPKYLSPQPWPWTLFHCLKWVHSNIQLLLGQNPLPSLESWCMQGYTVEQDQVPQTQMDQQAVVDCRVLLLDFHNRRRILRTSRWGIQLVLGVCWQPTHNSIMYNQYREDKKIWHPTPFHKENRNWVEIDKVIQQVFTDYLAAHQLCKITRHCKKWYWTSSVGHMMGSFVRFLLHDS